MDAWRPSRHANARLTYIHVRHTNPHLLTRTWVRVTVTAVSTKEKADLPVLYLIRPPTLYQPPYALLVYTYHTHATPPLPHTVATLSCVLPKRAFFQKYGKAAWNTNGIRTGITTTNLE